MYRKALEIGCPSGRYTGGAWLSSARVVRCWVKSRNERNPYPVLPASKVGDSQETAGVNSEEGGDEVIHHAPYAQGCKHATMAGTEGCNPARVSESHKAGLSSDWSLQLDSMKPELLVILDQHARVNTFPGLVHTARHTTKVGNTRSRWPNSQEREPSKVGSVIGVKS